MKLIRFKNNHLHEIIFKNEFETYPPINPSIKKIIQNVRLKGDRELVRYARKLNKVHLTIPKLRVTKAEIKKAYHGCDALWKRSLREMIGTVRYFHERQKENSWFIDEDDDVILGQIYRSIDRVGVLVPGGMEASPFHLIMNVIPALVAGVKKFVVGISCDPSGNMNPYLLAAIHELKISDVFRIGGVPAVAALTFGTKTVPRVDKIVGRGDADLRLAKYLVSDWVGTDHLSESNELAILADDSAPVPFVAADLIAMAEGTTDTKLILITNSKKVVNQLKKELIDQSNYFKNKTQIQNILTKNGWIVFVKNLTEGVNAINQISPREIHIVTRNPWTYVSQICYTGAIYVGENSSPVLTALSAGPNAILPDKGKSRFTSGLSWHDFVKTTNVIRYSKERFVKIQNRILHLAEGEKRPGLVRAIQLRKFSPD